MLSPAISLMLSTVRLHASGGTAPNSVGTGYFYHFPLDEPNHNVPVIITNKHVVTGRKILTINLQIFPSANTLNPDGSVDGEVRFPVTMAIEDVVIPHPDASVDLCAVLIGHVFNALPAGMSPKSWILSPANRLTTDELTYTRPIEPIMMIGYPNGLWDEVNNRPIARQGTTASHPLQGWNGQRYFVIDAACFPGSSGSPVFLYEDGLYRDSADGYTPGTRARLIGTLWGGPVFTAEGKLVPRAIPTNAIVVPEVQVMMNLGYVVSADALDDLAPLVVARAGAAR